MALGALVLSGCLGGGQRADAGTDSSTDSADSGEEVRSVLEGWVFGDDALPLSEANVNAIDLGESRITNAEGVFRFVNLPPGDHLVSASRPGFEPLTQRALVKEGYTTVLNFTLDAASLVQPYNETTPWVGQISCYLLVGTDPETGTHQDCGEAQASVDPNSQSSHDFTIDPSPAQVQIEVFWTPSTSLASKLILRVETVGFGHQDVVFAYVPIEQGGKVTVGQANMAKYYGNGGTMRITLLAGPSVTGDEAAIDVGFAFQQRVEVDYTVFYHAPGPSGFTARP